MPTPPYILRKIELCRRFNEDFLNLNSLDLTEIPPEVFELTHLKTLNAHHNRIKTLPLELRQLTQLETLGLEGNCIEHISPEMSMILAKIPHVVFSYQNLEKGKDNWKEKMRESIENADLDRAFDVLKAQKPDDNDVALLHFRYRDNERSFSILKTISDDDYTLVRNQIVHVLFSFLSE